MSVQTMFKPEFSHFWYWEGYFFLFYLLQDFGEYQESYYSVQTTEGEQISQLIAGYIDIILKKVKYQDNIMKAQ